MQHICITCGHICEPQKHTEGSFIGELALWVVFFVIASTTSFLILLIPLAYSSYRALSSKKVCEMCKSPQIIPVDSPNGKALINAKTNNVQTE